MPTIDGGHIFLTLLAPVLSQAAIETKTVEYQQGDTRLVGGVNVDVVGWGGHDGKYAVTKAKHSVSASGGYGTEIELRKCLEGY